MRAWIDLNLGEEENSIQLLKKTLEIPGYELQVAEALNNLGFLYDYLQKKNYNSNEEIDPEKEIIKCIEILQKFINDDSEKLKLEFDANFNKVFFKY